MTTSRLAKPAGVPSSTGRPPRPRTRTWTGFAQRYALVLIAILLFAICFAMIPQFRSAAVISSMLNSNAIVLLLALTATVTLRVGSFDLSIAQVMIASAVLAGVVTGAGLPVLLAAPLAVAFGAAVGLLNGWLVVKMGVDSFIVTLGTFTAVAGLSLLFSGSRLVTTVPDVLSTLTRTPFLGLPLVIWYSWLLAAILWFIYQRTPLGRYMLFIGGNATAAKLSGVRVDALRLGSFVTSGTLAAVIGLVYAGYFGTIDPSIGGQYMLQPFAAAFLGSTAIAVGRFNALGTVVALYLLTIGITGLQLLGAQTWVTNVFYGAALIIAVTAARLAGRRRIRPAAQKRQPA